MEVRLFHKKIPLKNSDILHIVGTVTDSLHAITTQMGYDTIYTTPLYVTTVLSQAGSQIFERWENAEQDSDSTEY